MTRISILIRRAVLLAALAVPLFGQTPSELHQILERLERLEEENRELAAQVKALRQELAAAGVPVPGSGIRSSGEPGPSAVAPASPVPAAPGSPTIEERLAVDESRIDEQAQTKVESSQRFPIRVTGMALFNAFLNSSAGGGGQYPTVAAGGAGSGGATVRQTTIGLSYDGPHTFANGKISGSVLMDFFGGTGGALDQDFRLRTAVLRIDWKDRSLRFGVDKPLIAPRDPNSLAQVAFSPLTGAGNLWLWIPQARFEQDFRFGRQSGVRAQVAAVQTREIRGDAPGPPGQAAYGEEVASTRPGIESRVEIFSGSEMRRVELAPGVHYSVSHVGGNSVPSHVYSFDWLVRPLAPLGFTGAFFAGQNVSHLGTGGIRQGFVVFGPHHVVPVHSRGGWGQIEYRVTPRLSFDFFSGQHDDRNSDLLPGRIGKNLAYGANVFFRLAPNVLASFEASQLRTVYLPSGTVLNNHYDLAIGYLF